MSEPSSKKPARVFVDAKIIGADSPDMERRTLVGYVVEGSPELNDVCLVKADQSDEAELEAVAFAIQELKEKLHRFTVISDHESVVSEIKRGRARPSSRPRLAQVQLELESHQSIQVDFLGKNPAHTLLNQKKHALDRVRRQT